MIRQPLTRISSCVLAVLGLCAGAADARAALLFTFSNPATITIPSPFPGPATPYPSTIAVSGVTGTVIDVNVVIDGFSHSFPFDVGALLVGPTGARTFLFDAPGDFAPVVNLNWIFDDSAAGPLPLFEALSSGTFQPNTYFPGDVFPSPAPSPPYNPGSLAIFNGLDPNGTWSLYVFDFAFFDGGQIARGWSLQITTIPEPGTLTLFGLAALGFGGAALRRRKRVA